jgi:hypothetical protein
MSNASKFALFICLIVTFWNSVELRQITEAMATQTAVAPEAVMQTAAMPTATAVDGAAMPKTVRILAQSQNFWWPCCDDLQKSQRSREVEHELGQLEGSILFKFEDQDGAIRTLKINGKELREKLGQSSWLLLGEEEIEIEFGGKGFKKNFYVKITPNRKVVVTIFPSDFSILDAPNFYRALEN